MIFSWIVFCFGIIFNLAQGKSHSVVYLSQDHKIIKRDGSQVETMISRKKEKMFFGMALEDPMIESSRYVNRTGLK